MSWKLFFVFICSIVKHVTAAQKYEQQSLNFWAAENLKLIVNICKTI